MVIRDQEAATSVIAQVLAVSKAQGLTFEAVAKRVWGALQLIAEPELDPPAKPLLTVARGGVEAAIAEAIELKQLAPGAVAPEPVNLSTPASEIEGPDGGIDGPLDVGDLTVRSADDDDPGAASRPRQYYKLEELLAMVESRSPASMPSPIQGPGGPVMLLRKLQQLPAAYGGMDALAIAYLPSSVATLQGVPSEIVLCSEEAPDIEARVKRVIDLTIQILSRRGKPVAVSPPPVPSGLFLGTSIGSETDLSKEDLAVLGMRRP
jgi:hypothetical protein